jgi:hypothetical protein
VYAITIFPAFSATGAEDRTIEPENGANTSRQKEALTCILRRLKLKFHNGGLGQLDGRGLVGNRWPEKRTKNRFWGLRSWREGCARRKEIFSGNCESHVPPPNLRIRGACSVSFGYRKEIVPLFVLVALARKNEAVRVAALTWMAPKRTNSKRKACFTSILVVFDAIDATASSRATNKKSRRPQVASK